jgi:hypothetical protein
MKVVDKAVVELPGFPGIGLAPIEENASKYATIESIL